MSYRLLIPNASPIKFVELNKNSTDSQHLFDDFNFIDTIRRHELESYYKQKWIVGQVPRLQFKTIGLNNLVIKLVKCNGIELGSIPTTTTTQHLIAGQMYNIVQFDVPLTVAQTDDFYLILEATIISNNTKIKFISEPQLVVEDNKGFITYEYSHKYNEYGVIYKINGNSNFEQSFIFTVEGNIGEMLPKSKRQVFEDQIQTNVLLDSNPYNEYSHTIGGDYGVPDWVGSLFNYIISHNNIIVENKEWVFDEGEIEKNSFDNYTQFSYSSKARRPKKTDNKTLANTIDNSLCVIPLGVQINAIGMPNAGSVIDWEILVNTSTLNGYGFDYLMEYTTDSGATWNTVANGSGTVFSLLNSNSGNAGSDHRLNVRTICADGVYSNYVTVTFSVP